MNADQQQTQAALRVVTAVLGDAAISTYLYGSAVLGGLRPDSDIDLLVVTRRTMEQGERAALVDALLDLSGRTARRKPGRPIELTVVVRDAVRPWSYPPQEDFQYGEWLRDEYNAGVVPGPRLNPDLAVLMTLVLNGSIALQGPPAGEVLAPVPDADLMRGSAAGVPALLDEVQTDTRNVLLTLARVWTTLVTGAVSAKDEAADWAITRLPAEHRPPMALAREAYLGQAVVDWEEQRVRLVSLCAFMAEQIAAIAPDN